MLLPITLGLTLVATLVRVYAPTKAEAKQLKAQLVKVIWETM